MTGASTNGIGVFNQNIGNWNVSNVTSLLICLGLMLCLIMVELIVLKIEYDKCY
jgi:hypothetical protein